MPFLRGILKVNIESAEDLLDKDWFSKSDPYVTGELGCIRLFKTRHIKNNLNPVWNEEFELDIRTDDEKYTNQISNDRDVIVITVKDRDIFGYMKDILGTTRFPCKQLVDGNKISGSFDLEQKKGPSPKGKLKMSIQFCSEEQNKEYTENTPQSVQVSKISSVGAFSYFHELYCTHTHLSSMMLFVIGD